MVVVKKIAWNDYLNSEQWTSLCSLNIESVILADMRFDLVHWLPYLTSNLKAGVNIQIHIYGNPIKRMKRLYKSNLDLAPWNLTFVVGSSVQQQVFENILNDPKNVNYVPFIPPGRYHYNEQQARKWKEDNNFQDQKLFLYSGRISFQKNVQHLMELFSIHTKTNPKSRLIIAGAPDNLNWREIPRANYNNYAGEVFFEKLQTLQNAGVPVTYLGRLQFAELMEVYNGCDHFVSLSTADGEDFGLSVAEALSVGLPCSLSAWGGYKEFNSLTQVKLSQVELRERSIGIDLDQFLQTLNTTPSDRNANEASFHLWKKKRMEESLAILKKFKPARFNGFKQNFATFCTEQEQTGEFFEQYKEFLSAYWT